MEYRNKLNVSDIFPFGIEIEIANKNITDIHALCEEHPKIVPITASWDDIAKNFSPIYADAIGFRNIFSYKNKPNDYWLYYFEDTNEENYNLGIEICSPILHNDILDWKNLGSTLDTLVNTKAKTNEKCSAHIHIGALPFNKDYRKLFNFFIFYLLYEPVFYKFSAMGSLGHIRKEAINSANPIVPSITEHRINKKYLEEYIKNNNSPCKKTNALHFKGFKLCNNQYGSSFELRMFNGTLDKAVWQNYINLVLSCLSYCIGTEFNQANMLKRCRTIIRERKNWDSIEQQIENADSLVHELIETIFNDNIDKDLFFEQYSGEYLRKTKGTI